MTSCVLPDNTTITDDIALLCPSRYAAMRMLEVCENWSTNFRITFSTDEDPAKSKTKAILIRDLKGDTKATAPLLLYGRSLPFVNNAFYLGQTITDDGKLEDDINIKRASFLRRCMEIKEDLHFAHPRELIRAIKRLACDHYGSNTWDLGSRNAEVYFNCWRTLINDLYDVDRATH